MSIIFIEGKIKKVKKIVTINIIGKIMYLKKYKMGYPDIKTINNNKIRINTTVDKLDCIIKALIINEGDSIYMKKYLNESNLSLYNTRFLHKKRIKLYFASSEGWKEIKPNLIQRLEIISPR